VAVIVFVESGQRRYLYNMQSGLWKKNVWCGQTTHLPLKVNTAGVIPPIFASSIIMFPATFANFIPHPWMKDAGQCLWFPAIAVTNCLYLWPLSSSSATFIRLVTFNPVDVADNMKKIRGYVPGYPPW